MKIHRNTTVSILFSFVSLGITFYQYRFTPHAFDYRIIAGAAALVAVFAAMSEFMKYTSRYQFIAVFFGAAVLGISIDRFMHTTPFITIALLVSFTASIYRYVFRKWISEHDFLWMDPLLFFLAITSFIYGNLTNDFGWRGWAYPVPVFLMNGYLVVGHLMHSFGALKYIAAKNLMADTGKTAPGFSLCDQEGNEVNLADYSNKRDVLLLFVRGDWCPSCHIMLRTYQRNSERFSEKNVLLLAIGPDPVQVNKQMALTLGIEFKVLSDVGQRTAMAYSVQLPTEVVGEKHAPGIPLPASFLIDKKGVIRYASRPGRIGEFLDPMTIFPILESLN